MTKALTTVAVLLAVCSVLGTAALASEIWDDVVLNAQDAITHE